MSRYSARDRLRIKHMTPRERSRFKHEARRNRPLRSIEEETRTKVEQLADWIMRQETPKEIPESFKVGLSEKYIYHFRMVDAKKAARAYMRHHDTNSARKLIAAYAYFHDGNEEGYIAKPINEKSKHITPIPIIDYDLEELEELLQE